MKTVYSNTRHPSFCKWSSIVAGIVGFALVIIYGIGVVAEDNWDVILYIIGFSLFYFAMFFSQYKLLNLTIDEENDTVTESRNKKYPLRISKLATITYKESKKGKFRSIFLHDDGVGFMDIRTSKSNADKMVAQLLKANPSIEIKHANYL